MKIQKEQISKLILNPKNPRIIKDVKFQQLVASIKAFPDMLEIRPIVVNKNMMVLGGNMRLNACKEAGLEEVPILIADNLTKEQEDEFIIKDNLGYGEWDWDIIANEWNVKFLGEWGLDVLKIDEIDIDDFFIESPPIDKEVECQIILQYTKDEYDSVIQELNRYGETPSVAVKKILNL